MLYMLKTNVLNRKLRHELKQIDGNVKLSLNYYNYCYC